MSDGPLYTDEFIDWDPTFTTPVVWEVNRNGSGYYREAAPEDFDFLEDRRER